MHQGDPLFHYLFVLCANFLSRILKKEAEARKIHGIQVAREAPVITDVLFVDDSLLFARASSMEVNNIMATL